MQLNLTCTQPSFSLINQRISKKQIPISFHMNILCFFFYDDVLITFRTFHDAVGCICVLR